MNEVEPVLVLVLVLVVVEVEVVVVVVGATEIGVVDIGEVLDVVVVVVELEVIGWTAIGATLIGWMFMVEFDDVVAGYTVVVVVTVVPVWVFVVEDCSVQILVLALKLAQYSHLPRSTTK